MGQNASSVNVPKVELPENYTAIVTGGHQGLGYEVSKYLALLGARVILACESESHAKAAILRIQADAIDIRGTLDNLMSDLDPDSAEARSLDLQSTAEPPDLKVEFMKLDMRALDNVVHFAETYKARGLPLNLVVCGAGVVHVPKNYTEDGFEHHFQLNYLGHFLLCLHMLPLMKEGGGDNRIVHVTSKDHTAGEFNLKTVQGKGQYNKAKYYANSKMYQIMHMYSLHRRLESSNVSVYAVHSGAIDTAIKKNMDDPAAWGTVYNVGRSLGKIMSNLSKNVTNTLSACISPQLHELRGSYFVDGVPVTPSLKAKDIKSQEVLWRYSLSCADSQISEGLLEGLSVSMEDIEEEMENK